MKITSTIVFLVCCLCGVAFADIFGSDSNQFEIEFVTIGNPGNPPDRSGLPLGAGQVDYEYNIGKFEISRATVEAANAEAGLGIVLDPMAIVTGGPRPDMPATGISWNEAARFVNWLNTSHGYPVAYKFLAQPGEAGYHPNANQVLWEPTDLGYDPDNLFRNRLARYVLPSMDEWYKAAFYDPNPSDGPARYFNYPTGSDEPPTAVTSGTDPDTAVYLQGSRQGPADITQAGGLSAYGVMAMGGNVWEWEETELDLVNDTPFSIRGIRGGRWVSAPGDIWSFNRDDDDFPTFKFFSAGFRVASMPERTSILDFDISPGVGRFEQMGDNVLLVEPIQDGYRVRVLQSAPQFGERPLFPIPDFGEEEPRFTASWPAAEDQWYRFQADIRSVSTSNGEADPQQAVAPLESMWGLQFGTQIIPPDPLTEAYSFMWPYPPNFDLGDVQIAWDFTAVPIDPPIPGDADADGVVGFSDFVALANRFGEVGAGWGGGDFNLDGISDFEDFVILVNYVSGPIAPAAVPEPSTGSLSVLCIWMLGLCRKRWS